MRISYNNGELNLSMTHDEIEQSLNLLFQIIDLNQDNKISQNEINELKGIVESLK